MKTEFGKAFIITIVLRILSIPRYMARKVMGVIREFGDNIRHDKWYRETMYAPEDREVMLLLVLDNHMTDEELYKAMQRVNCPIAQFFAWGSIHIRHRKL